MKQRAAAELEGALKPVWDMNACLPRDVVIGSGPSHRALLGEVGRGPTMPGGEAIK